MLVEVSRIGSDPTIYENKIALKLPISLFDIVPLLVGVISQQNGSDFMQHFWSIMLVEVSSVGLDPTNYENKIASNLPISLFDIVPLLPVGLCLVGKMGLF